MVDLDAALWMDFCLKMDLFTYVQHQELFFQITVLDFNKVLKVDGKKRQMESIVLVDFLFSKTLF